MIRQDGLALILVTVLALIFVGLVALGIFALGLFKLPSNNIQPTTSNNLKIDSPLKNQYKNPFSQDEDSGYVNPFENLK